jgi:hypothetical protein
MGKECSTHGEKRNAYKILVGNIEGKIKTMNISTISNLRGLSPRANCTDRATAACRRIPTFTDREVSHGQLGGSLLS